MPYAIDDTIAAIASAPGGAARGIVRISGPGTVDCLQGRFLPDQCGSWPQGTLPRATSGSLALDPSGRRLHGEMYLWPGGRSYTGQLLAEFHTLGSPPLLEAVLRGAIESGARLAEPGEFTLRAFLSGRLDLTQAEAVLGVIDAADTAQLDVALAQLAGGLSGPLGRLRERCLDLLAHLEAGFDFADEDLPFIAADELAAEISIAAAETARLNRQMESRGESGILFRVVLVGQPNVGKSSLFNALAGPRAIVADEPGTTRDYLTAELDLEGVRCQLVDTAGVQREPERLESAIVEAAQRGTAAQVRQAQIELLCLDASRPLTGWEQGLVEESAPTRIAVWTKADAAARIPPAPPAIATSTVTGEGIAALRERIRAEVAAGSVGEVVAGTAARCRESLHRAAECFHRALVLLDIAAGEELIAAEIRLALQELGKVTGTVYTDDVLDRIFSRFCIGK